MYRCAPYEVVEKQNECEHTTTVILVAIMTFGYRPGLLRQQQWEFTTRQR